MQTAFVSACWPRPALSVWAELPRHAKSLVWPYVNEQLEISPVRGQNGGFLHQNSALCLANFKDMGCNPKRTLNTLQTQGTTTARKNFNIVIIIVAQ